MSMYHNRPHVEDIRKLEKRGEKISILLVSTLFKAVVHSAFPRSKAAMMTTTRFSGAP